MPTAEAPIVTQEIGQVSDKSKQSIAEQLQHEFVLLIASALSGDEQQRQKACQVRPRKRLFPYMASTDYNNAEGLHSEDFGI